MWITGTASVDIGAWYLGWVRFEAGIVSTGVAECRGEDEQREEESVSLSTFPSSEREEEESDGELSEGMAETDRQLARIEKVMRCNKCPPCGCGCHGEEGTRDCTHQRKDGGDYRGNQTEAKKEEGGQKSGTRNGQK